MMLGGVAAGPALALRQTLQGNPALVRIRLGQIGMVSPINPSRLRHQGSKAARHPQNFALTGC